MAKQTAIQPAAEANALLMRLPKPSEIEDRIMVSLTAMVVLRTAESSAPYLRMMAAQLSKEPLNLVSQAIEQYSREPRREGEGALPSLGVIIDRIRVLQEPVGDVRHVVRTLAKIYEFQVDEDVLCSYENILGHRTIEDLEKAKLSILKEADRKRMPKPGELLKACGTLYQMRKEA